MISSMPKHRVPSVITPNKKTLAINDAGSAQVNQPSGPMFLPYESSLFTRHAENQRPLSSQCHSVPGAPPYPVHRVQEQEQGREKEQEHSGPDHHQSEQQA